MRQFILVLALSVCLTSARWVRQGGSQQPRSTRFVGDATSELTSAILQGYIDDDKNIAFSPLGYAAILAILAEGARGETRNQLVTALHLPEDPKLTRRTYKYIMERLKNTNDYKYNQPELKNYFYIYKNYTINEDYKKILEECYLTDVRSVERYNALAQQHENDNNEDKDEFVIEISDKNSQHSPEIPETMPLPLENNEKLISFAVEDTPGKVDLTNIEYKPAKNIKEKIKLVKTYPKKDETGDEEETMVAVEARNHARSLKVLSEKHDITSSLSVNSVGQKSNPSKSVSNSLMIIFNGMYYRGSWAKPFDVVESGIFYKSSKEKKPVPMMKTSGKFMTAMLPGLDSEVIKLPYDGGRYALMIILPRSRDGLTRLIADMPATSISEINESLREQESQVTIPTFYSETTTKPISALAKFGVSSIFSRDADLTGVSSDEGLFVQELVQHVAVRIDNEFSSASEIAAGNVVQELSKNLPLSHNKKERRFSVEHPFVYLIVDSLDNLVVVAGKVVDPEQPTPFDI